MHAQFIQITINKVFRVKPSKFIYPFYKKNLIPFIQKSFTKMRAKKTSTTGNKNSLRSLGSGQTFIFQLSFLLKSHSAWPIRLLVSVRKSIESLGGSPIKRPFVKRGVRVKPNTVRHVICYVQHVNDPRPPPSPPKRRYRWGNSHASWRPRGA